MRRKNSNIPDPNPEGPNPSGLCMCGCGGKTPIADRSRRSTGMMKGKPMPYIHGHWVKVHRDGDGPNPEGWCLCGCGERAPLALKNHKSHGEVSGKPVKYIPGHWGISEQKCISCKKTLPRDAFAVKYATRSDSHGHSVPNGIHSTCKDCQELIRQRVERPEYIVDPETGCWNWNRSLTPNGYGITGGQPAQTAHRYVYERERGPIPEGMTLDHLCRNRACVNPSHLEPVPQIINSQRSSKAILNAKAVREIRKLKGILPYHEIGSLYGVSYAAIAGIMNGSRWRNVEDDPTT